jgi:glycosyltransferase involved in cell wall biosynthesis
MNLPQQSATAAADSRPIAAPRKIIGIISFMNSGGAQEALLRLARQLRARGHDMEVWFLYEVSPVHRDVAGTRVIVAKPRLSLREYLRCFVTLVKAIRAARPDAVIGFLPLGNVFGLTAAALADIPARIASQRSPGTTYGKVMRLLDRIAGSIGIYSSIVCVSGVVAGSFASYGQAYRRRLRVVHNGIEWQGSSKTAVEARAALGLPQGDFIVAALGRLSYQKNYGLLLDAVAAAPGVTLAIGGGGELANELESQARRLGIEDRVHFLGVLSRDAARDLLRAADAFAQSSLFEGQSNAVLEAMHAGLPVLLADIPEQRETIEDEHTRVLAGILAPLADVEAWAGALGALRDSPAVRHELGAAAAAMVARRFSLDRMIGGFEAAIAGAEPRR